MLFETLNGNHVEYAAKLALNEYLEERDTVTILPDDDYFDLLCGRISDMTSHGLGVAAIEEGQLVGLLGYSVFAGILSVMTYGIVLWWKAFGITNRQEEEQ